MSCANTQHNVKEVNTNKILGVRFSAEEWPTASLNIHDIG